ncbi:MAG TPA: hypothetical protein VEM15_13590, partial [Thermodesulfobacteriota bacterium]|nr:hypothetical protein [Thermodesulfobacteriota bacterium]
PAYLLGRWKEEVPLDQEILITPLHWKVQGGPWLLSWDWVRRRTMWKQKLQEKEIQRTDRGP